MDFLAVLCFFAALISMALAVMAYRSYYGPKRDSERWVNVASSLGLTMAPRAHQSLAPFAFSAGPSIHHDLTGERDGVPIRVGVRIVSERSLLGAGQSHPVHYTYVVAKLPRSLQLGLHVSRSGGFGSIARVFGSAGLEIGVPEIDSAYRIDATIPQQAVELLRAPQVRETLERCARSDFALSFDDEEVRFETREKCLRARELEGAIAAAVETVRRLGSTRGTVSPTHLELVLDRVWRPFAASKDLAFDAASGMISGRLEGMQVEVRAVPDGEAVKTVFVARFARALRVGLRLEKQGPLSKLGVVLGMQDIETGDADFDRRFVVKGAPVGRVQALLTTDVRGRLAELQDEADTLAVEDDQLRAEVATLIHEAHPLDRGVTRIARAAAALTNVPVGGVGPQRMF